MEIFNTPAADLLKSHFFVIPPNESWVLIHFPTNLAGEGAMVGIHAEIPDVPGWSGCNSIQGPVKLRNISLYSRSMFGMADRLIG